MIILDTNVVSELSKPKASDKVVGWFDLQSSTMFHFTSIGLAEVLSGLVVMPDGKRKSLLSAAMDELIAALFGPRILPFDAAAAREHAEIVRMAHVAGRPLPYADAQIAAIARANKFAIATRDAAPFLAAGIEVINPWENE